MASSGSSAAVLPQLPPDFFDKPGRGGAGAGITAKAEPPDTLPADFFDNKPSVAPQQDIYSPELAETLAKKTGRRAVPAMFQGPMGGGESGYVNPWGAFATGATVGLGGPEAATALRAGGRMAAKYGLKTLTSALTGAAAAGVVKRGSEWLHLPEPVQDGLEIIAGVGGAIFASKIGSIIAEMPENVSNTPQLLRWLASRKDPASKIALERAIRDKKTAQALGNEIFERENGRPPDPKEQLIARGRAQAEVARAKAEGMPPKAPKALEEVLGKETFEKLSAKVYEERFGATPKTAGEKLRARGLAQAEVAKAKASAMPAKAPKAQANKLNNLFKEGDTPERPVQPLETTQPAPGMVRLYRGQPGEHEPVSATGEPARPGTQFTTDKKFAELYSGGKPLLYVDVPESVFNSTEAKAAPGTVTADVWGRQAGRVLPPEYANQAKRLGAPDVTSIAPAKSEQQLYREKGMERVDVNAAKKNINLWRLAQSKGMTPDQVRALPDAELDALIAEAGYSPVKNAQGEPRTALSSSHDKLRHRIALIGETEQKFAARPRQPPTAFSPKVFSKIERVRSKRRAARQSEQ